MATNGALDTELIKRLRANEAPLNEALATLERGAYNNNGCASVPVTETGRDIVGINAYDRVIVGIFSNALVIVPKDELSDDELEAIDLER